MTSIHVITESGTSHSADRACNNAVRFAQHQGFSVTVGNWADFASSQKRTNAEIVLLVPQHVGLSKSSIVEFANIFATQPSVTAAYADDTRVQLPDFSPQRLLCQNYIRGPIAVRVSSNNLRLLESNSAADVYSFLLDLNLSGAEITHAPMPLFSSEGLQNYELSESEISEHRTALVAARQKRGGGTVGDYLGMGAFESRGIVQGNPLVSIVIPTQAKLSGESTVDESLVINAVKSIVENTDYENFELVIIIDAGADQPVLDELEKLAGSKLTLIEWKKPFNFSQKMNFGVLHAQGEYVLLLNDDVQVLNSEWLSSMLSLAQLPNAGMVGAMLYYEDDTIQHAGHAYFEGSPTHIGLGLPRGSHGPLNGYLVAREAPGVTAACALMPLTVFKEVGGFTALLPGNFNDVDLCLKVGWRGYDIYWTPDAELYHFESKTRDAHVHYYELDVIEHRWGLRLNDSRYWRGHPWAAN